MKNCILAAGVALGGSAILCGCGDTATTASPTADYDPKDVDTVWGNHFGAFVTFDVDKIMLDYDETSRVSVFNDHCAGGADGMTNIAGLTEFTGTAQIRGLFESLFTQLDMNASNIVKAGPTAFGSETAGPSVLNEAPPNGNVFLTWASQYDIGNNDIPKATDSFSFRSVEGKIKIWKQNIVTTEATKECNSFGNLTAAGNGATAMAWANHFGAFAEQNITNIMKDYTDSSVIQVWDNLAEKYEKHETLADIQAMFESLFAAINSAKNGEDAGVKVPLISVNEEYNDVFLVWESFSHPKATDTFVFDANGKIARQNIVVTTKPAMAVQVMV